MNPTDDRYADLDETELRYFTLSLADNRHPAVCARCHKERIPSTRTHSGCTCTTEELRAWLGAQPIVGLTSAAVDCARERARRKLSTAVAHGAETITASQLPPRVPIRYTGEPRSGDHSREQRERMARAEAERQEDIFEAVYWRFDALKLETKGRISERDAFKMVLRELFAPGETLTKAPLTFRSLDGERNSFTVTAEPNGRIAATIEDLPKVPSDQSIELVTKLERLVIQRGETIERLQAEADHLETRTQMIVDENVGPRPVGSADDNLTRIERQFADLLRENAALEVENNRLRRADEMDHRGVLVDEAKHEIEHLRNEVNRLRRENAVASTELERLNLSQADFREQLANHTKVVQERDELRLLVADIVQRKYAAECNNDYPLLIADRDRKIQAITELRDRVLQYEKDQRELCARLRISETDALEARNILAVVLDRHTGEHSTSLVQCAHDVTCLADGLASERGDLKRAVDAHNAEGLRRSAVHSAEVETLKEDLRGRFDKLESRIIAESKRIAILEARPLK